MILVYTHTITPRVAYVMNLVFDTVLNTPYKITDSLEEFEKYNSCKIAYTLQLTGSGVFMQAQDLLFESDIKPLLPLAEKGYTDYPKFFKSTVSDLLGYDLFSMVFYFASRYEEYVAVNKDNHQRFRAEDSIAFQYNCLHMPFLNKAIEDFSLTLKNKFPGIAFSKRAFNFLSTIDIDNAFAFAHKGWKRNTGGFVKDLFSLRFTDLGKRIISNINDQKDPYNTYGLINHLSKETDTALQYFVLIGDYSSYDKNPDHTNVGFQTLLKSLSSSYRMGLHPSYESYTDPKKIAIEKKRLENIIGKKVTSARCHFLRINLPETYRTFIANGITDDYTMIYASQTGFRTGLCVPFKWFDLQKNEPTDLIIHTSVVMEGILRDYNKFNVEEAKQVSLHLLEDVKKYGGEFISVFHNDSFVAKQKQWIELYKSLLISSKQKPLNN